MSQNPLYPSLPPTDTASLTHKSFQNDQDVRWCPGCGDYSILAQVHKVLPTLGIPREDFVFVSGIGCSSRFPYYMNTYGLHTIHGRAPAVVTGVKALRPELSVWMITGDGDSLSIGGNHLIHLLRRNVDVKVLLFNNRIYGLTKGQYSPTSEQGKRTKSSPLGSIEEPFNPLSLALGARASFVARSIDIEAKHLQETLAAGAAHKGTALVEILQNCNIFNDGAFEGITDRRVKAERQVHLVAGEPALFGAERELGLVFDGSALAFRVARVAEVGLEAIYVHDPRNLVAAQLLVELSAPEFPVAFGVIYARERGTYEDLMAAQLDEARGRVAGGGAARPSVQALLESGETWRV
jgi:2-oxoglutarate ferredoxin oxidoreductase subunit beta